MSEIIKVGMADLKVCSAPDGLTTLGLGSCVGIAMRDPVKGIGGLAHIMLPDSTIIKDNSNRFKFADTGIDDLISQLLALGANRARLESKIAGGAQMFAFTAKSSSIQVGARNVEAVKAKLAALRIPLLAEDTGQNFGRTVVYYPENGSFLIRAVGKDSYTI
ncbi:MAG: chemotaxis protein CheD [Lachnospiraceae bacterium]|nr:chemotaxis protein CheD [Lachnospiraceae bacterium]